jgi:hypothetical protein
MIPLRPGLVAACFFCAPAAQAALLDFETLPGGGAPADNLAVTGQYEPAYGVTFAWRSTPGGSFGAAALELRTGRDRFSAFANSHRGGKDIESAGAAGGLGQAFLRGAADVRDAGQGSTLLITYSRPTAFASGELWDIDDSSNGTEQWRLTARDAGGAVLQVLDSPLGDSKALDGLPWLWTLGDRNGGAARIAQIEIAFIGSKTEGLGFAFDKFETGLAVTPAPAAALLLAPALLGLGWLGRRRRPAQPCCGSAAGRV